VTRPVYCDESVWIPVANGLQQRGWTVHTAREQDMLGSPDRDQVAYATAREWIMLTFDDDFITLVKRENVDHSGIIYVNQVGKRVGDVIKAVDKQLQRMPDTATIVYL